MNIRQQRKTAWIGFGLLLLMALAIAFWGWQERNHQRVQLADLQNQISALEDRLRSREQVLAEIRLFETRNPSKALLLSGATPALAAAQLQGLVNQMIERSDGLVETSELIRPETIDPFIEVGVAVQFVGTIQGLRDIPFAMENAVPAIIVTSIDAVQEDEFSRQLLISLQVKGFSSVAAS